MALPFLVLLLLVASPSCLAQPSPPSFYDREPDPYRSNFNALTAVLIVAMLSAFVFLAFFSLYFRRCSRPRPSVAPAVAGAVASTSSGGLDPAVIGTFPTMPYSAVTGVKIGKEALECAVCLSEFSDGETLRMLPRCCHVFHPHCIDTWLGSHVTCPVCRDDLSVGPADGDGPAVPGAGEGAEGEVAICMGGLGRSHSTGHVRGAGDRFTLRLPEHVRREVVEAGSMRRSASVAVFGGGGEGSLRRGAGSRSLWAGLSDRWASGILTRVSTWRSGESSSAAAAEGSVRGGTKLNEDPSVGALGRV